MIDERLLKYCSSESQIKAIRAVIEHGTQRAAAEALDWNKRTLERHLKNVRTRAREQGDHHLPLTGQSHVVRDEEGKMLRWDKTNINNVKIERLYRSMEAGVDIKFKKPTKAPKIENDSICALLPIADPHFGMLAWSTETGGQDYDLDIAKDMLLRAVGDLLSNSPNCRDAFLINLGDWCHFDGMKAQTPQSGNILDADSRYGRVIEVATAVYMAIVDMMLTKYETVTLCNVRGNHDESSGLWMNVLAKIAYKNEPRIQVLDNNAKMIKFQWGKNLVVTHHGDGINHQKLYEAITRDYRREHGEANYTLGLTGHFHNETVKTIGGVRFEQSAVMTPVDAWHASNLYGGTREISLINLRKSGGIQSRTTYDPVLSEST